MDTVATERRVGLGWLRGALVVALAAALTVASPFLDRAVAEGSAATLSVSAPSSATAGSAFSITVTARDAAGAVATSYRGRVTFSSTDSRSPVLPAAYTFTTADAGRHTFTGVKLFTAGSRTIAAFDTVRTTVKGRSAPINVVAARASRLTITAPTSAVAGAGFTVTVAARDAWFNIAPSYRGTVAFTSTDARAVLPAPATFTAADRGVRRFAGVQLRTAGSQTTTVADRAQSTLSARTAAVVVAPAKASRFAVSAPSTATAGVPITVTVTAKDQYFNIATGYRGTVAFTSTDPSAPVPSAPYTFMSTDRGVHAFTGIRLGRGGRHVFTVTDTASSAVTGSTSAISVAPRYALYGWGVNGGALGDGTTQARDRAHPVLAGVDTRWASLAGGGGHVAAIKSDGTLWTWGQGFYGALGHGATSDRTVPGRVGTDTRWVTVAAGYTHTLAVKSDGTMWGWGNNDSGQVGDGTETMRTSPVQIGAGRQWAAVSADEAHSVALAADGSIWVWGLHSGLMVGEPASTGNNFTLVVPTRVGTDTDWAAIEAGTKHILALKKNGSLWGWGANFEGATGQPEGHSRQLAPTRVGTGSDWVRIEAGHAYSLAIKADGTLWGWGWNGANQLGNGTLTDQYGPAQVVPGTWRDVAAGPGAYYTAAIRGDSTQWAWGQLPGTAFPPTPAASPTQVGTMRSWIAVESTNGNVLGLSSTMLP